MKRTLIYIATLWAAFACTASEPEIRTGDLLFEVGATSEMSGAITAATGDDSPLNFTHVGIAITCEGADSVLEATSNGGVRMTSLDEFLKNASRINDRPAVVAMRLSDTTGVAASVARGAKLQGTPLRLLLPPGQWTLLLQRTDLGELSHAGRGADLSGPVDEFPSYRRDDARLLDGVVRTAGRADSRR